MAVTIVAISCDMLESDPDILQPTTELEGKEVFVLSNSASFIDLNASLKSNVPARIAVTSDTRLGKITDLGKGILQYEPTIGNSKGRDNFEFTVYTLNNEIIKRDTVIIVIENDSTNLPCNIYPRPDYVYGVSQDSVVIDVLGNDIICGSSVTVSVFKPSNSFPPYFGQAEVLGNKIKYVPGSNFQGADKIMYKISSVNDSSHVAYGMVYITNDSACNFRLSNDQYVFNHHAVDSLAVLPVFENDSLCHALNRYLINLKAGPQFGQVFRVANGFSYKVPATISYPFTDNFTYEVCLDAVCKTARVDIKVKQDSLMACTIYARPDSFDISTLSTNVASLQVLLNDSICGSLKTFEITRSPKYGTSVINNNVIKYERTMQIATYDSLQYRICNDVGCSVAAVVIKRHD